LGTAGEHRHGITALDDLRSLADTVRARRAGADDRVVWTARLAVDGDDAGGHVRDHHRHRERADPLRTALHQLRVALLDLLHAADAGAHDDTDVVGVHVARDQAG